MPFLIKPKKNNTKFLSCLRSSEFWGKFLSLFGSRVYEKAHNKPCFRHHNDKNTENVSIWLWQILSRSRLFYSTTWSFRRGEILPSLEFFCSSWVLEIFWFFENENSCFWTYFAIEMTKCASPPWKNIQIWVIFLTFFNFWKKPPRAWVFFLSFWLEF